MILEPRSYPDASRCDPIGEASQVIDAILRNIKANPPGGLPKASPGVQKDTCCPQSHGSIPPKRPVVSVAASSPGDIASANININLHGERHLVEALMNELRERIEAHIDAFNDAEATDGDEPVQASIQSTLHTLQ